MTLAHWDEVEREVRDVGDMRASSARSARPPARARSAWRASTSSPAPRRARPPPRLRGGIFFVLSGSASPGSTARSTRSAPATRSSTRRAGPPHTLIAGPTGSPCSPSARTTTRRSCACRARAWSAAAGCWLEAAHDDPLEREAAAGPLDLPAPTPRPPCIVALEDIEVDTDKNGEFAIASATSRAPPARSAAACATRHPPGGRTARRTGTRASTSSSSSSRAAGTCGSTTTRARSPRSTRSAPGHSSRARPDGRRPHAPRRRRGPDLPGLRQARPDEIVFYPRSKKAWLGRVLVRARARRRLLGR